MDDGNVGILWKNYLSSKVHSTWLLCDLQDTLAVAGKDSLAVEQRVGTDSVVTEKKADSIQSVDIRKNVPARMNPREMKENNAADHSHSDRPQRIKRRN